jgi:hypothetical protein
MATSTDDPARAVDGLVSVARLLDEPRLARVYTHTLRAGPVTVDDLVAELDLPRTTAYADTGTLVDLGLLDRDDSQKTHRFTAEPIHLTATLDGDTDTVTPTLVAAVGQTATDDDLELLVERHGLGTLAAALTYAVPYAEGRLSERVAARELDVQMAFGIAALQALRSLLAETRAFDPYVDEIGRGRPAADTDSAAGTDSQTGS